MTMRTCFAFLTALLLLVLTTSTASAQMEKTIRETLELNEDGLLSIDTYKGSITITTWDREEVEVDVLIEADDDDELVEDTEIIISGNARRIRIETDYDEAKRKKRGWSPFGNNSYSLPFVHYTIRMPRTAALQIDDYKSEIDVRALEADMELETYKGSVEIRGFVGGISLETYKGDVYVQFDEMTDDSSFETYKGDIDIDLPEDAAFDLDAELGKRGDLNTDFRLRDYRSRRGDDNEYRGRVNGGGPELRLDTYRGQYRIRTR